MKLVLGVLLILVIFSCSDYPVAVGDNLWYPDHGWKHGDDWVHTDDFINGVDKFSVQLQGTNVTDYYRNYLNFSSSSVKLTVVAHAHSQSMGKVAVRLYAWDGSMLHDTEEISLNGEIDFSKTLHLNFVPKKIEVEFLNFSGAVVFELLSI